MTARLHKVVGIHIDRHADADGGGMVGERTRQRGGKVEIQGGLDQEVMPEPVVRALDDAGYRSEHLRQRRIDGVAGIPRGRSEVGPQRLDQRPEIG